jgi:hypothetical protein
MEELKPWLKPGPQRRPKVVWKSSIPYGWRRVMEIWDQTRQKEREQQGKPKPNSREMTPLKAKKGEIRSKSRLPSSEDNSKSFYSIKYLGITNGEIGILSQRKPIPCKSTVISQHIPKAQSLIHLISDPIESFDQSFDSQQLEERTREEAAGTHDDLEDSLVPAPERYNEFVVTKYMKARPLTPGKRGVEVGGKGGVAYQKRQVGEGNNTALGLHYITPDFQPARRQRRGVSGWKLSRPHSSAVLSRPSKPFFPKDSSSPSLLPAALQSDHPEAYIQYLLRKTHTQLS